MATHMKFQTNYTTMPGIKRGSVLSLSPGFNTFVLPSLLHLSQNKAHLFLWSSPSSSPPSAWPSTMNIQRSLQGDGIWFSRSEELLAATRQPTHNERRLSFGTCCMWKVHRRPRGLRQDQQPEQTLQPPVDLIWECCWGGGWAGGGLPSILERKSWKG